MVAPVGAVAVQQNGIALWRKPIFVGVDTDARHTRLTEVKATLIFVWRGKAGFLEEGNDEGSQAAVDVKGYLVRSRKAGKSGDVVNNAMWKVGRRANQKNSVPVDQTADRGNVDLVFWSRAWNAVTFDPKVIASLVKRGMGRIRDDPISVSFC